MDYAQALCVEAEGEVKDEQGEVGVVNFFTFFENMAVASDADKFGYEEPDGADYALSAPTEERYRGELVCDMRSRGNSVRTCRL